METVERAHKRWKEYEDEETTGLIDSLFNTSKETEKKIKTSALFGLWYFGWRLAVLAGVIYIFYKIWRFLDCLIPL